MDKMYSFGVRTTTGVTPPGREEVLVLVYVVFRVPGRAVVEYPGSIGDGKVPFPIVVLWSKKNRCSSYMLGEGSESENMTIEENSIKSISLYSLTPGL